MDAGERGVRDGQAVLVFDASPLVHFGRARRLQTLEELVAEYRCVTTRAVKDEVRKWIPTYPQLVEVLDLPWLEEVRTDSRDVLYAFAKYMDRLGDPDRNAGEASVLAWAEVNGAVAFVDDQTACDVAGRNGVDVRRTLALIVRAYTAKLMSADEAQELVRQLVDEEARLPRDAYDDLIGWAQRQDLLPVV